MSAEKDLDIKTDIIYIPLLNEGTPVLRPTLGLRLKGDIFKVLATEDYDPDDEEWEFPPMSIVDCKIEQWNGEDVLVARENVDSI